jgi:GrpB-like predicted nucleotidyltransferase (UPF0157 family)
MNEQESLLAAIFEEVALHDYEPSWPMAFCSERERIEALLPGAFIELQHIGSTSIQGMPAKPIIDILAGVNSMAQAESLVEPICRSGYSTSAEFNETLNDRKWFMRWANGHRTHHLHVVVHDDKVWHERLRFRDTLRSHPELAASYASLKFQLAAKHTADREAYTDAKAEFVRSVLEASNPFLKRTPSGAA